MYTGFLASRLTFTLLGSIFYFYDEKLDNRNIEIIIIIIEKLDNIYMYILIIHSHLNSIIVHVYI